LELGISLIKKDPSPKTQNPRTKNQDLLFSPFGIWSLEFGTWNLELGI
jgi:hypothetical protein